MCVCVCVCVCVVWVYTSVEMYECMRVSVCV